VIIGGIFLFGYNSLVSKDTAIDQKWGDVEAQYQRRADLIPNLVSAVKGYMSYEQNLLDELTATRTQWLQASTVQDKITAGQAMDGSLGRLIAVAENYPDLKASENVNTLMVQVEGTENRIAVARMDYNSVVRDYKNALRAFPTNMVAGMFGFQDDKPYFEAGEGADVPATVDLTLD
jgi:LemA protein